MSAAQTPLWQALRTALDEQGLSVRRFAKLCHEARPSQSWDSWKRTVTRALDRDAARPYYPGPETAELWARLLGQPADAFIRRRPSKTDQIEELKLEVARLRAELDRRGREGSGPGQAQSG